MTKFPSAAALLLFVSFTLALTASACDAPAGRLDSH
jgi:hypothetical protein